MKISLSVKFSAFIISLIVVLSIVLSLVLFEQFRRASTDISRSSLKIAESEMLEQVKKNGIAHAQTLARSLADHLYFFNMDYIGDIVTSAKNQQNVHYVYLYDLNGSVIHDGSETMSSYGKIINDIYSKRIQSQGSTELWIDTQTDNTSNKNYNIPIVNISVPIKLGENIIGGVRIGLSLEDFQHDISVANSKLSQISQRGTDELLYAALSATLLLILIGAIVSVLLARRLSKPISNLAYITSEIGEGRFMSNIPDLGDNELGELASSIKMMSGQRQKAETDLIRSETRLKYLLSSGHALIYAKDVSKENETTFISSNVTAQLGYSVANILSEPGFWIDHIHPSDQQSVVSGLHSAVVGKQGFLEYRFLHADGTYRIIRDQFIYSDGNDGGTPEIIGTLIDITEQRAAEADLQRHQKAESIGNLTSGIAHNLNNLLQPIIALSYLAKLELPSGSPEYENMDVIEQAGSRAAELIRRIMTFSREGQISRVCLDVCEIVQETIDLLHSTLPSTIKIIANLDRSIGVAMIDGVQFQTVIMNMASNAVYAMKGRHGTLTFSLCRKKLIANEERDNRILPSGQYAKLSISDTGTGMTSETLIKIFDPFFTTKDVGQGTGLGLSTAYGNIHAMGGVINVSSELGSGTTFDILVPLLEDAAIPPSNFDNPTNREIETS